jgi:hypothetical protein
MNRLYQPYFPLGRFRVRYPILWDGHLVPPNIISRLFMPAPQEILRYFFIWKSLNSNSMQIHLNYKLPAFDLG